MGYLRSVRGTGQHAQLIGGEVTLLNPDEHAAALAAMEAHGRKPMSMTHGDFDYDYLKRLAVGPDGRRRFDLLRFAGHFDSLMLGRRDLPRPRTEGELDPYRRRFVDRFEQLRREHGVRYDLAHNMTVTPRNLDQVADVVRAGLGMGFGMMSVQPAAYVGNPKRWREDFHAVSIDSVWREIERGAGTRLPWRHLQMGDQRCNRSAYGVLADGHWTPLLDDRDQRDVRARDAFLDAFGGMDFDRPRATLAIAVARVIARHPGTVPIVLAWSPGSCAAPGCGDCSAVARARSRSSCTRSWTPTWFAPPGRRCSAARPRPILTCGRAGAPAGLLLRDGASRPGPAGARVCAALRAGPRGKPPVGAAAAAAHPTIVSYHYDLVVVGGGTGGLVSSLIAAGVGARVALIERDRTRGDCLWTSCVRDAIRTIQPHDSPQRLRAAGVEVIPANARFDGPGRIRVDGRGLRWRAAIIATGSGPLTPPIPGLAESEPLNTETVWDLREAATTARGPGRRPDRARAGPGVRSARLSGDALPVDPEDQESGRVLERHRDRSRLKTRIESSIPAARAAHPAPLDLLPLELQRVRVDVAATSRAPLSSQTSDPAGRRLYAAGCFVERGIRSVRDIRFPILPGPRAPQQP